MTNSKGETSGKAKFCDHKFVDSKVCLKCGWRPFCGRAKYSHDDSCCPKDPNRKLEESPK